jgi:hypothetical protein
MSSGISWPGKVYILYNKEAKRVKVGMTINNVVTTRQRYINRQWWCQKGRCQICGKSFFTINGHIPYHRFMGKECLGSHSLCLERDTLLGQSHLQIQKFLICNKKKEERHFTLDFIRGLRRRITTYKHYQRPFEGSFELKVIFKTMDYDLVEKQTHKLLIKYLDSEAPLGEVYNCSVRIAEKAITTVLSQLNLLDKVIIDRF